MQVIKIGTRESRLAVVQAEVVASYIHRFCEGKEPQLVTMKTTGDKILDRTLDKVGGKGLFVKELERSLREGSTDISVHSLKDIPMETPGDLPILGVSPREDARDVLALPFGRTELNPALPLGTSSPRRVVQLGRLFPQMKIKSVRGNVQTRLAKLDRGEYSGLVLAAAGLKRLGLEDRISRYFTVEEMIPAAGQGILAIQGRQGEDYRYLEGFFDEKEPEKEAVPGRAKIIAVDFDGTLVEEGKWPEIGATNHKVLNYCKREQEKGTRIILWTNRAGEPLDNAIKWCEEHGLRLDAVNDNLQESVDFFGSNTRIEFDACPKCLDKVVETIKQTFKCDK